MAKNIFIMITGGTFMGPITKVYINVPRQSAIERFLKDYPQNNNPTIKIVELEDEFTVGPMGDIVVG
ncbi:hypothetical protein ACO2Q8_12065 [Larkinella sp. VNQ87]|uniref:hypothetical protein n=1 Tax=Larkinella sp. VNQ87 TaxID=3400921 RepID=UPI003C022D37